VFREFYMQIGTKVCFAFVRHPQSNGLFERENGIILQGIYKRLCGRPKGKWAEELTSVIWSHNTSELRATKFTPFKLLFSKEAVLLEEITHKSPRVTLAEDGPHFQDEEQLTKDLAEELRCQVVNNLRIYEDVTIRWRNKKVNPSSNQLRQHGSHQKAKRQNGRQALTKMARAIPRHSINQTGSIQPSRQRRQQTGTYLEYRRPPQIIPLAVP
jgi:hypothetical protein